MSIWHHDKENRTLVMSSNPWQLILLIVVIVIMSIYVAAGDLRLRTEAWRVHHAPLLTSQAERDSVKAWDELHQSLVDVNRTFAAMKPDYTRIEKWLLTSEVEKREHASVSEVQIKEPDSATVSYRGGVASVRFRFVDPMACKGSADECFKRLKDNPTGFTVLAYEAHPAK
ncbi:hypothetical protein [Paraburkholderia sp. GAS32]|uniref:hypothetical protein n=1 Tax=Paraburkholderia sp. GAS32 TaxID=3035129 RepID=UPI003D232DFB